MNVTLLNALGQSVFWGVLDGKKFSDFSGPYQMRNFPQFFSCSKSEKLVFIYKKILFIYKFSLGDWQLLSLATGMKMQPQVEGTRSENKQRKIVTCLASDNWGILDEKKFSDFSVVISQPSDNFSLQISTYFFTFGTTEKTEENFSSSV